MTTSNVQLELRGVCAATHRVERGLNKTASFMCVNAQTEDFN